MKKYFDGLLKSEIKKAEALANKLNGSNNCKVSGYSWQKDNALGKDFDGMFYTAVCEICHDYERRAENDVVLHIFMPDRRRSFATDLAGHTKF